MGLDTVELVLAIEDHFGIEIPDQEAERMRTAGDIYDYVICTLELKRGAVVPEPARRVAWNQLVDLIATNIGVDAGRVTKDAEIVKDLGAN